MSWSQLLLLVVVAVFSFALNSMMINSTMTVCTTCSILLSQPVPPHFIHRGFQDGRTPHTVCAEFYGGMCWVPGAGKSWKHTAVHALHNGELWAGRGGQEGEDKEEDEWLLHSCMDILFCWLQFLRIDCCDSESWENPQVTLGVQVSASDGFMGKTMRVFTTPFGKETLRGFGSVFT